MSLTIAQFREIFPEFSDTTLYPDTLIDSRLLMALHRLGECFFGDLYDDAQGFLTAHLLLTTTSVPGTGGTANGVVEVQDGSTRIRFREQQGSGAFGAFDSTGYGQQYLAIVRLLGGGPRIAQRGWPDNVGT